MLARPTASLPETERRERALTSLADSWPSVVRDAMVLERGSSRHNCNFSSRLGSKIRANLEFSFSFSSTIQNISQKLGGRFEFWIVSSIRTAKMTKKSLGGEE